MTAAIEGYFEGIRGCDPRLCPYEKLTAEWKSWRLWYGWGVDVRRSYDGGS